MKKIINLLILFVSLSNMAQIKGNKEITTRTFNGNNIKNIKINFYAQVIIDQSKTEGITITTDANLFDYIEKEVVDGTLYLDQKEWIQPSENAKIVIGAPKIRKVESGTHDTTRIINLDNDYIQVLAPIGKVFMNGKTKELRIASELASVDASDLIAENARVDIWSRGTTKVFVTNEIDAKLSNEATLNIMNTPKKLKGDAKIKTSRQPEVENLSVKYIKFKIQNNSLTRNHFFVIGPKPDGSSFSYGFPMMPQATRKENWTTGTKVYKVSTLGKRKLLITIKEEDKDTTVPLF
ncbi:GIN domain-containing protein [Aquimarina sp. SS2-1]|uniref:GIN domain-containing protein n=1 Tax=Aquimarina besae TaxID=3342247 RepID=UPI00366CC1A7